MIAPHRIIADDHDLLPDIRELFSRFPEYRHHQPWELQWLLFALSYSDELEDENEIAAALEALQVEGEVLA
jgi:hypothetical protein